jgi:hypothetical protein
MSRHLAPKLHLWLAATLTLIGLGLDGRVAMSQPAKLVANSATGRPSSRVTVSDQATVADSILVCPEVWMDTLQPWLQLRHRQGHRFFHIKTVQSARSLREQIIGLTKQNPIKYVVLVGDTKPRGPVLHDPPHHFIPAFYVAAKVNVLFGSEPEIPTDHPYGDLDSNGGPELAVGRIAVSNAEQLATVVEKIVAYENAPRRGLWQRRVHFVAGMGGFGRVKDAVIEAAAKKFVTDGVPPSHRATMTYASWQSPYCPDPRALRTTVLDSLNQGSLFWVYMGHGHPYRLDRFKVGEEGYMPILESEDVQRLNCVAGNPIAVIMACYTGAFDQDTCLAEALLRQEHGPVAVLAGSRVTMPYGMAAMGSGLLEAYFSSQPKTLGDMVVQAEQAMLREGLEVSKDRRVVDSMATLFQKRTHELSDERREHVLLFNLLGDPLLRPIHPREVQVDIPQRIQAGQSLTVQIKTPVTGWAAVELVCPRDRFTFTPDRRSSKDTTSEDWKAMTEVHRRANDKRWAARQLQTTSNEMTVRMTVPEIAHGPAYVRVFVQGRLDFAVGSKKTYIRRIVSDEGGPKRRTAAK